MLGRDLPLLLAALFLAGAALAVPEADPFAPEPGALDPAVTPDTLGGTICRPGWVETARPSSSKTDKIKAGLMTLLPPGADHNPRHYELDHVVPIEGGGAPFDTRNLVLMPYFGPWNAHDKDRLENAVHRDLCAGRLSLAQGRAVFLAPADWRDEYRRRWGVASSAGEAKP